MSSSEWYSSVEGRIEYDNFMIPSPGWVDPKGRLIVGTNEFRPFEAVITNSKFSVLKNNFDPYMSMKELSAISCKPHGMAWSVDNSSLFISDGHTRAVTKCDYNLRNPDVSDCQTILTIIEEMSSTAVPKGIATDENNHIWVAVANNDGKGAIMEIDPETSNIISTIELEDPDLVDIVFGGEDMDFLYILSTKHLYKMTGLGVRGMYVPGFIWQPEL